MKYLIISLLTATVLLSGCKSPETGKLNPAVELKKINDYKVTIGYAQVEWTEEGLKVWGWLCPKENNRSGSAGYIIISATDADGQEVASVRCDPIPHMFSHHSSHRPRFSGIIPLEEPVPLKVIITHHK